MGISEFLRITSIIGRCSSNVHLGLPNIHNTQGAILSKVAAVHPLALSSALTSPIGSVRTKRRLRTSRYQRKLEFHLDKRFPFEYTFRQAPTLLSHPGDQDKSLGYVDKSQPKLHFSESEELKSANEDVKRLFSLGVGTRVDVLDSKLAEVEEKIKRYRVDNNSEEMNIGRLTVVIRYYFEKFNENPGNVRVKIRLLRWLSARNKIMNKLCRKDENRFNWLMKILEIDHKMPLLGVEVRKPTRKLEISRLTDEYCDKLRNEKIAAYQQALKAQQPAFLEEKKKTLEWITQEEEKLEEKRLQLKMEEELFWKKKACRK